MPWDHTEPGSDHEWAPAVSGVPFSSLGGEAFEFPHKQAEKATVKIENYFEHYMWFRLIYKTWHTDGVVAPSTVLQYTAPVGATEIQYMDWDRPDPGSDSEFKPTDAKPFSTEDGQVITFKPGATWGSGASKEVSGPTGSVVVLVKNHNKNGVWLRFVYANGAVAQVVVQPDSSINLTVPAG